MCARLRVRVGEGGAVFYILRGGAVILRYASVYTPETERSVVQP